MVEPVYYKEKIMIIGNRLQEIRKSKKSQMSLRDMLVLAPKHLQYPVVVRRLAHFTHYAAHIEDATSDDTQYYFKYNHPTLSTLVSQHTQTVETAMTKRMYFIYKIHSL